jgi:protein-S-isoprenylcysteine O-methyltransferase Ste14
MPSCKWLFLKNLGSKTLGQIQNLVPHRLMSRCHPMYAGMIFYLFCAPLLLGSWWGLPWGLVLLRVFAIRIQAEEGTLRKQLPGYNEYAARVRYRMATLSKGT